MKTVQTNMFRYHRISLPLKHILGVFAVLLQLLVLPVFQGDSAFSEEGAREVRAPDKPRFEMEEVVVTASGIDERIQDIPKNVTVITSDDIEQAPSNDVTDLLAREAGITLRSFFGNDKQAVLDIRGMGATAVSNVIVMVDGFRLNTPDMAGADLSSVPLDQIDRIEIVRGAGSVLYGDGAVGGVINIITKKGSKTPETRLHVLGGSYETFDGRFSHRSRTKNFSIRLNTDYFDSDGYRDNGFLRKKDAGVNLGYTAWDKLTFSLSGSYHEDDYGLPGPVSKTDFEAPDKRRQTDYPHDDGETTDKQVVGGLELDLGDALGIINIRRGYRFRDNDFILGYTPLLTSEEQTKHIDEDTKTLNVGYTKTYTLFGLEHRLRCGLDHYMTEYVSAKDDRKNSKTENLGLFLMTEWRLREDLTFRLGYRYNTFDGTFRTDEQQTFGAVSRWVNGIPVDETWRNDAYETGLVYEFKPDMSFFIGYATSFRIPNVDELAESDDDLHPQEGEHFEFGARTRISDALELTATLFHTSIRDEIYYGEVPGTGIPLNRNFEEKTIRKGIELDAKFYPTDALYLWGNLSLLSAKFEGKDTRVPLTPAYKSTIGLEWEIIDSLVLAITGTLVGSRYDGLDEDNDRFEKLDAYQIFDSKITYTRDNFSIFAGINNIFDELYASVGYGETYYPMPERNFFAGVKWLF